MSGFETVTVEQFKDFFYRDFPFLPIYDGSKIYWKDDVVYEGNFYKSLKDNNTDSLDNAESWQIVKDDIYNYITDTDIEKAMTQARVSCNPSFGDTCQEKTNIFLHLVAYYLVIDIKNSSSGINSSFLGTLASKSVGDVSESYAIPQWMTTDPMYSIYGQNGYGLKYLSLITPYMSCTILFSRGSSTCG